MPYGFLPERRDVHASRWPRPAHARRGDGGHVRVRDNGAGIPPEALHDVFELFNRGGRPNRGQSAGIGLAVVRRLVELHGGTVTAASEGSGRGSEFIVVFPRAQPDSPLR